jgi:hypothetical protein
MTPAVIDKNPTPQTVWGFSFGFVSAAKVAATIQVLLDCHVR